jgi:uncharacterized protein (TIGR02646 family)
MRHIVHSSTPPASLDAEFRKNPYPANPTEAWNAFEAKELRDHLWDLQHGLCAYCERVLDPGKGGSSIDHVVPKSRNPRGTFDYANLVLSCMDQKTCNIHKKGDVPWSVKSCG